MDEEKMEPETIVDRSQFYIHTNLGIPVYRGSTRDPMGVYVYPTGLTHSNVAGAEVFVAQARARNLDPKQFCVVLGGSDDTFQVVAYVADAQAAGATAVRQIAREKTLTLYLHELFRAKPALRPEHGVWCPMQMTRDTAGEPCILISLRVALPRRKVKQRLAAPAP